MPISRWNSCVVILIVVVWFGSVAKAQTVEQAAAARAEELEELWLAVSINRQDPVVTLLLRRADGRFLARGSDFERWRLKRPPIAPQWHRGEPYYALDALPRIAHELDVGSQTLTIQAPAALFLPTSRFAHSGPSAPTLPPPGAFLNYDFVAQRVIGQTRLDGLVELGAFNGAGVGTATALARDLEGRAQLIRLETTWTRDAPEALASLRAGDSISRSGTWSLPVRFGGVQWATNFAVRPGFVTFPLPAMSGEAALPSTVDLFINDALRGRAALPPGPFTLPNLPVITGEGELRVVVRDLLGREQVLRERYYASPRLLRPGLTDFAYQAGFLRSTFGIESNDYEGAFAAAAHRTGLTERFTGEVSAELLRSQQTAGASGTFQWDSLGLFTLSAAGSRSERGNGALSAVEFERQSRSFSVNLRTQVASNDFTQLGLLPGLRAPIRISEARAGFPVAGAGTVSLGYVDQHHRDRPDIRLASLSYQVKAGPGSLLVSAFHIESFDGVRRTESALSLTFTMPLDGRTSVSIGAVRQAGRGYGTVQAQRNLPAGEGLGYRLLARSGTDEVVEGGVSAQRTIGTYTAEAARSRGETAYRLSAAGGLAWLDGSAFLSRRLSDSFALVRVGEYAGVRVYADNQPVARTDAEGSALVPRLRAYDRNLLRIEQADLPLDAEIEAIEREAVPYFRSGLVVSFPVRPAHGALLRLILEDGKTPPPGAQVRLEDRADRFPVGLDGEVYLTGLAAINRARAEWNGRHCIFEVRAPQNGEPVPHFGTVLCREERP
ncbi:MAG: fimbrial biogenesis outer membrane usher protein [Betaproteobacteria bacterium]|nr:fimbrial biogenesis outer membrane usher protein [Betaproteobacteria bacterium]